MMENDKTERSNMRGKLIAAIALALVSVAAALAAIDPNFPPYSSTFNMEWDEEVQVSDGQTIWVHRAATYLRSSKWKRWDARKVAEQLKFTPTPTIGEVDYRIELGAFGGIERMGDDWALTYAGTDLGALHIGSCTWMGRGPCYLVIRANGSRYKPANASEVLRNFHPIFRCRTNVEDCYRRVNEKKLSLNAIAEYNSTNPTVNDNAAKPTGKPFPFENLTP
jgi:hypothetical protein